MHNYKHIILLPLLLGGFLTIGQETGSGKVLVANDYRDETSSAIVVKWFDEKVYYPDGFNVYRRKGTTNWVKLNEQPLNVSETAPEGAEDVDAFLKLIKDTPYKEFQDSFMPAIMAINAILDPSFADLIGIQLYDETAQAGKRYQYRVTSIDKKKENLVGISPVITSGDFLPQQPPQDVQLQRRAGAVDINWKPEVTRYYGVHVYRKSAEETDYQKITEKPYVLQRNRNEKGELEYPEVFFIDTAAVDSMSYNYRLTALDFFGQESPLTKELATAAVDFEAPLPPINLNANVDTLKITLTWDVQRSRDLVGFNVYRFERVADEPQLLNSEPLQKRTNSYVDQLTKPGGYYYAVAAVDDSGNENFTTLFIEVRDIVAPKEPQELKAVSDTGRVVLTWQANQELDLAGYVVYRSLADDNNEDNSFVIVTSEPVTKTQFEDKLPKNARNRFVYAVGAVDTSLNYSNRSAIATVQLPDVTPPLAPVITGITSEEEGLSISWIGSGTNDVKGYRLFKASESDPSDFQMVGTTLASDQTAYQDAEVSDGVKYTYYLMAVDEVGNESVTSNTYSRRFGKVNEAALDMGSFEVSYLIETGQAQLTWQAISSDDLKGYIIYRGTKGKTLRPITGFETTIEFMDSDLPKEGTVTYQVKAYGTSGLIGSSEKKMIQIINDDN